ncbi:MAG TPA: oligosaccharide flippase family protein [Candidatus Acidoferrales bacterium]|nr:oligosaccharide flippase family protein [Candidatus Acidoferrales bacterium]
MQSAGSLRVGQRLARIRDSRLARQNLILFAGGLVAGLGGFVYHAIAGRVLGPATYGEVASLIALYAVGNAPTFILTLVLARYAATLLAHNNRAGIRSLLTRTTWLVAIPGLVALLVTGVLAVPFASFLHLGSPIPLLVLGFAIALVWQLAMPRGILQGMQRFTALSSNLSLEMVVRMSALVALLWAGYAVSGAMAAVVLGITAAYGLGLFTLRGLPHPRERARLRAMAGFSLTAAAGTLGVLLLYNQDVILARHYLDPHAAGIYGGLNKIGSIIFFLTLSVSQVMFPRVVEAVAKDQHPGRLLLISVGLIVAMGSGALIVFGLLPGLVVRVLFGAGFLDAVPYILLVGVIGIALSLDNLLVQFLMAVHDRVFVPILAGACALQAGLIVAFHDGVGQVVADTLFTLLALVAALVVRYLLLLPRLRPEMVVEEPLASPLKT